MEELMKVDDKVYQKCSRPTTIAIVMLPGDRQLDAKAAPYDTLFVRNDRSAAHVRRSCVWKIHAHLFSWMGGGGGLVVDCPSSAASDPRRRSAARLCDRHDNRGPHAGGIDRVRGHDRQSVDRPRSRRRDAAPRVVACVPVVGGAEPPAAHDSLGDDPGSALTRSALSNGAST